MNHLIERLQRRAASDPGATALRSRDKRLGYGELMDAVHQASRQLRSLQLRSIGLFLDNGLDWIIFDLAALQAGISVVPLPWFFSDAQIAHAIADARLDGIVFDRALPRGVEPLGTALPGFSDSRLQRIDGARGAVGRAYAAAARISYTSGSTGAPKGIALDAGFIELTADSLCQAIGRLDIETHLGILPYATLLENIAGIYVPLLLGRCVHAEPAAEIGLGATLAIDPERLRVCFNRVRPNSLIITPQLLDLLCLLAERAAINPDCLVFVAVGGARVSPASLRRARHAGIPAYEGYGLTEFGSVATLNTPWDDRVGSVGKPLPGVTLVIAEDGEICLSRRAADAVEGAGATPRKPIRSGDLGSVDADGFVHVHGRKSNLIVLANGRNVSPEWIEAELNFSSLIEHSFVFAEDGKQLSVLIASSATGALLDAEIARINRDLPAYARLQRWYRLADPFSPEAGTLTVNGRLRRAQIERQLPGLLAHAAASPSAGRSHMAIDK
jgi:long-subunit acyl-CoA synthetase (AMP-forming)